MLSINFTYLSAYHNLALEEALLNACEAGNQPPLLRFWEPQDYFVVLGHGKKIWQEVHVERCQEKNIPILRRISGGGTVVNGPGCLNYALFLPITGSDRFENITDSNRLIIEKNLLALNQVLPTPAVMQGSSDMVINGLKFSGNAQKRKKKFLLFHGTFLLNFDLSLIAELLPLPAEQPSYRQNRPHEGFVTNLGLSADAVMERMMAVWQATPATISFSENEIEHLVNDKYRKPEWIYKF